MVINEHDATSVIVVKHQINMKGGTLSMLQTQINYWSLQENIRHNLQQEALGWANNVLEHLKLMETKRHNLATEDIEMKKLAETMRHNLVSEDAKAIENGINTFLANTKAGELELKQIVDPVQASASMVAAKARASAASASHRQAAAAETRAAIARQEQIDKSVQNSQNASNTQSKTRVDRSLGEERNRIQEEYNKGRIIVDSLTEGVKAGAAASGSKGKGGPRK